MTKLGSYLLTAHSLPPPCSPSDWKWCAEVTKYLQSSHSPKFTPVGLVGAWCYGFVWQGFSSRGL